MALKDRKEIGKEVAQLLAENRASVAELYAIFDWAKQYLVVTAIQDDPERPES